MRIAAIAASLLTLVGLLAAVPAAGGKKPSQLRFRISGSISGLRPGVPRLMRVKVHNPYRRPLRVLSVRAHVGGGRRFCTGANLHVRPFRGRLVVPRRRTRTIRLRVEMPVTAAPECLGARFPLYFRGKGVVG
jgi:hypothetical protein